MIDEDARDLAIHQSIDSLVTAIADANGWSRRQVFDRFECFIETEMEEQRALSAISLPSQSPVSGECDVPT